ncbi:MAG: DUF4236 domain-containing protein [Dysgonomonas sp.]|uniref:DUF4236 domain-containing protein n=1 Tax=Dysgonomonas sp. TaxID=1891233 RepID=UPI0039E36E8F
MAFRFHKRIKILPGLRLNVGKTGVSTTVGRRGLSVTSGKRGTYLNTGLPGTGLSYRQRLSSGDKTINQAQSNQTYILQRSYNSVGKMLYIIAVLGILLIIGLSTSDTVTGIGLFSIIGLILFRFMSKAHKAKPYIKKAEYLCQDYQYTESLDVLKQAYAIYPNDNIKQDIEDLQSFIENEYNNLNNE